MGVRITTTVERRELATAMDFLVAHEPKVHYSLNIAECRPVPLLDFAGLEKVVTSKNGLTTECAGSVTILAHVAGIGAPNGDYHAATDTQIIYDHLPHYSKPSAANVGALCWFGIPGDLASQHITAVRHPGPDPILFSHGQERGPLYVPMSVELAYHRKAHPGSVGVFLSIAHL